MLLDCNVTYVHYAVYIVRYTESIAGYFVAIAAAVWLNLQLQANILYCTVAYEALMRRYLLVYFQLTK